jgi:hypothetical protein
VMYELLRSFSLASQNISLDPYNTILLQFCTLNSSLLGDCRRYCCLQLEQLDAKLPPYNQSLYFLESAKDLNFISCVPTSLFIFIYFLVQNNLYPHDFVLWLNLSAQV